MAIAGALFNLAFGIWCIGWPASPYAPWMGALNMFISGLLTASAVEAWLLRRMLRHV